MASHTIFCKTLEPDLGPRWGWRDVGGLEKESEYWAAGVHDLIDHADFLNSVETCFLSCVWCPCAALGAWAQTAKAFSAHVPAVAGRIVFLMIFLFLN